MNHDEKMKNYLISICFNVTDLFVVLTSICIFRQSELPDFGSDKKAILKAKKSESHSNSPQNLPKSDEHVAILRILLIGID